jgi:hypothetical protein
MPSTEQGFTVRGMTCEHCVAARLAGFAVLLLVVVR